MSEKCQQGVLLFWLEQALVLELLGMAFQAVFLQALRQLRQKISSGREDRNDVALGACIKERRMVC